MKTDNLRIAYFTWKINVIRHHQRSVLQRSSKLPHSQKIASQRWRCKKKIKKRRKGKNEIAHFEVRVSRLKPGAYLSIHNERGTVELKVGGWVGMGVGGGNIFGGRGTKGHF